jgi:LysM repeat protein
MRQESSIRKNAKTIALLFFIGLVFADIIIAFYLVRERLTPTLLAVNQRVYLPVVQKDFSLPTATPAPVTPTPTRELRQYTVQPGDTLFAIAQDHGVSLEDLAKANNISDVDLIIVGQVLIIPGTTTSEANPPEAATPYP